MSEKTRYKFISKTLIWQLNQMAAYGTSKHSEKERLRNTYKAEHSGSLCGWNSSSVPGKIFSYSTMETYQKRILDFAKFVSASFPQAKHASDITKEMAVSYLKSLEEKGFSAYTTSTAMSAINKCYPQFMLNKKEIGLRERNLDDIKRSRFETQADHKRTFTKYNDQITVLQSCGIRRQSILRICPADFSYNKDHTEIIGITVREKGGKTRTVPLLNSHRAEVTQIVEKALEKNPNKYKPLFDSTDKNLDIHGIRAEYAKQMRDQLMSEMRENKPFFGGNYNIYDYIHIHGKDKRYQGKMYKDTPAIIAFAISNCLGHNRLSILNHYL